MIELGPETCKNFDQASSREWLETNGIGGFACGSVSGANTRRYHSYLTAATDPPLGRITTISKIEESLVVDGVLYDLSSNQYAGAIHPAGYRYLESFRLDPFPVWEYVVEGIRIRKSIFMAHGENTTVCQWKILTKVRRSGIRSMTLRVRPLVSFVDYHHLQHEHTGAVFETFERDPSLIELTAEDHKLFIAHNASHPEVTSFWYRDFELKLERERGFDHRQDLFQPFELSFDLKATAVFIASAQEHRASEGAELEKSEIKRRKELVKRAKTSDEFTNQLVLAADQFIVTRGDGHTVIAGYPWFSDWGRDTMIALRGLTLATNRPEIARNILLEFSRHISAGMLPNRFADADGEAEYNNVDATLWYFEAVRVYLEKTGEDAFVRKDLYPALVDIIGRHGHGTRFQIRVESDGLLHAGEGGVQLTWMDAKIGDQVITPRAGKPVEIQALWYNALAVMSELSEKFGDHKNAPRFAEMAAVCKESFNRMFWNEAENCLFDVVSDEGRDPAVRPNQIFAASLHFSMLENDVARAVVDKVEAELLTPVGLRSLSPRDPAYAPHYEGSPFERDSAYHQGTVWPWLLGAFIDAYKRVYPHRHERMPQFLNAFRTHLLETGLGQVSEIFDAEQPHLPRGCFAQAWSVAEVLRVSLQLREISRPTGSEAETRL